jgi:ABC-type transport system substrate-binding protein
MSRLASFRLLSFVSPVMLVAAISCGPTAPAAAPTTSTSLPTAAPKQAPTSPPPSAPTALPKPVPTTPPAATPITVPTASTPSAAVLPVRIQAAPTPAPDAKKGGTLTAAAEIDVSNLDPQSVSQGQAIFTIQNLYSTLLAADPGLGLMYELAEKVDAPTPTTYVFVLRKGVKFHTGRELVGSDVKYSLERLKDKKTGSPYSYFMDAVASIDVPDSYTVKLTLSRPDPALLYNLTSPTASIVSKEVVDQF